MSIVRVHPADLKQGIGAGGQDIWDRFNAWETNTTVVGVGEEVTFHNPTDRTLHVTFKANDLKNYINPIAGWVDSSGIGRIGSGENKKIQTRIPSEINEVAIYATMELVKEGAQPKPVSRMKKVEMREGEASGQEDVERKGTRTGEPVIIISRGGGPSGMFLGFRLEELKLMLALGGGVLLGGLLCGLGRR